MIGERLLDLRKDHGLTQQELGNMLHINKHSISSYERDISEPPDSLLIEIAGFFNVSCDYLLGLTDDPTPYYKKNAAVRVLRLPAALPDAGVEELEQYLNYLLYKYLPGRE